MASRSVNFDLNRDLKSDNGFRTSHPRGSKSRSKASKWDNTFNFENPSFVLVVWNFLLALPLAYTLTLLLQHLITAFGFHTLLRPFVLRGVFVGINMWFVVGWGVQLEREGKEKRVMRMREEVLWWENELARLEGELDVVREREVEDQIRRESPGSGNNDTERSAVLYGAGTGIGTGGGTPTASVASHRRGAEGVEREDDESVDEDVDDVEEEYTENEIRETDDDDSGSAGGVEWR